MIECLPLRPLRASATSNGPVGFQTKTRLVRAVAVAAGPRGGVSCRCQRYSQCRVVTRPLSTAVGGLQRRNWPSLLIGQLMAPFGEFVFLLTLDGLRGRKVDGDIHINIQNAHGAPDRVRRVAQPE